MKYFIVVIFLFSGILFSACNGQTNQTSLGPKSFDAELKKDSGLLIDVRTPDEYAEEHLEGATLINYQDSTFANEVKKLDKNKPVYLYCRSGKRSAGARDFMISEGFKKVVHLKGGILAWKNDGMPVKK